MVSGLLGAGATLGAGALAPGTTINTTGPVATGKADGGEIQPKIPPTAFLRGGPVPGRAPVPGDDQRNDIVDAKLSPGEVVIPRTVAQNPSHLGSFLAAKAPQMAAKMAAHPSDIASVMRALQMLRQGA